MTRQIVLNAIKLPTNHRIVNKRTEDAFKNMSHVPGQASAIRFFDPDSESDFVSLKQILSHKLVKNWMDDVSRLCKSDYQEWAGAETDESFLFAVHDTRLPSIKEIAKIRGFVNFYFERSEKFRLKRLIKTNLVDGSAKHYLEVSMALLMDGKNTISTGLMSSALRQGCLQVKALLKCKKQSDLVIFGFIDPKNEASIRSLKASGFIKKGDIKYDSDSTEESGFYVIRWPRLHRKIKGSLLKMFESKVKIINEPQITDSHCGPAVTKALLGFNGVEVTQDQVVSAAQVTKRLEEHGMRPKDIAKAVAKLAPHLQFLYKNDATSHDLHELIKKQHLPVGVNWQGLFYDSVAEEKRLDPVDMRGEHGHLSVIIDFEPKKDEITIDDPYSDYFSAPRIFSYKWFSKRWWDKDRDKEEITQTHRCIFIVVPKNTVLPNVRF